MLNDTLLLANTQHLLRENVSPFHELVTSLSVFFFLHRVSVVSLLCAVKCLFMGRTSDTAAKPTEPSHHNSFIQTPSTTIIHHFLFVGRVLRRQRVALPRVKFACCFGNFFELPQLIATPCSSTLFRWQTVH